MECCSEADNLFLFSLSLSTPVLLKFYLANYTSFTISSHTSPSYLTCPLILTSYPSPRPSPTSFPLPQDLPQHPFPFPNILPPSPHLPQHLPPPSLTSLTITPSSHRREIWTLCPTFNSINFFHYNNLKLTHMHIVPPHLQGLVGVRGVGWCMAKEEHLRDAK